MEAVDQHYVAQATEQHAQFELFMKEQQRDRKIVLQAQQSLLDMNRKSELQQGLVRSPVRYAGGEGSGASIKDEELAAQRAVARVRTCTHGR